MKDWNVVVTSYMRQQRRLLQELAPLEEFHPSGFAAVLIGKVPDLSRFMETLDQGRGQGPEIIIIKKGKGFP